MWLRSAYVVVVRWRLIGLVHRLLLVLVGRLEPLWKMVSMTCCVCFVQPSMSAHGGLVISCVTLTRCLFLYDPGTSRSSEHWAGDEYDHPVGNKGILSGCSTRYK